MRKYLFIISLFLMIFIPHNVFALNYTKGEEVIEVDCSNFIYYAYQNYKDSFEDYTYFIYYHNQINTKLCGLYFINKIPDESTSNSNNVLTAKHGTHGAFQNIQYNTSTGSVTNNISSSDNNSFTLNLTYIIYLNFSTENYVTSNITVNDLENYFSNSEVEPDTPPIDNPTINDEFDSQIHNISISILGDDIPYEFDYIYIIFDFLIILVVIFCLVAPFVILFKIMGVI